MKSGMEIKNMSFFVFVKIILKHIDGKIFSCTQKVNKLFIMEMYYPYHKKRIVFFLFRYCNGM